MVGIRFRLGLGELSPRLPINSGASTKLHLTMRVDANTSREQCVSTIISNQVQLTHLRQKSKIDFSMTLINKFCFRYFND